MCIRDRNKTADGLEYRIMYFDADRYEKKREELQNYVYRESYGSFPASKKCRRD